MRQSLGYTSLYQSCGLVHNMGVLGGFFRCLSTHSPHHLLTGLCYNSVLMDINYSLTHLSWVLNLPGHTFLDRCEGTNWCSRSITSMSNISRISLSLRTGLSLSLSLDYGRGSDTHIEQQQREVHRGKEETDSHLVLGAEAVSH